MRKLAVTALLAVGSVAAPGCSGGGAEVAAPDVVIGVPSSTTVVVPPTAPAVAPDLSVFVEGSAGALADQGEPAATGAMAAPDGAPPGPALPFSSGQGPPEGLVFVLVAGSDARPGEDLLRTRADSIHLLALNPVSGQGTIVGFPRDSYVEIPGVGRDKLNSALSHGGPDLLAETVKNLTGLPVDFYVITGFVGFQNMVDEIGGIDLLLERRMNDRFSGARFERGWHHLVGGEALAFSRNRNDVAAGDLSRSANQGLVLLAALAKMRAETGDDADLARWAEVLVRHARLDVPLSALPRLAAAARRTDPARVTNVVAPGKVGTAGRASVVYLTTEAARLFEDLRDGVVGEPLPPPPSGEVAGAVGASTTSTEPGRTGASAPTTSTAGAPDKSTTPTTSRVGPEGGSARSSTSTAPSTTAPPPAPGTTSTTSLSRVTLPGG